MPTVKLNAQSLSSTFDKSKSFLGNSMRQTKQVTKNVHRGSGLVTDSVKAQASRSVGKGVDDSKLKSLTGYDSIRNQVMDTPSSTKANVATVVGAVKKRR
jgi:hypothetical protein